MSKLLSALFDEYTEIEQNQKQMAQQVEQSMNTTAEQQKLKEVEVQPVAEVESKPQAKAQPAKPKIDVQLNTIQEDQVQKEEKKDEV